MNYGEKMRSAKLRCSEDGPRCFSETINRLTVIQLSAHPQGFGQYSVSFLVSSLVSLARMLNEEKDCNGSHSSLTLEQKKKRTPKLSRLPPHKTGSEVCCRMGNFRFFRSTVRGRSPQIKLEKVILKMCT